MKKKLYPKNIVRFLNSETTHSTTINKYFELDKSEAFRPKLRLKKAYYLTQNLIKEKEFITDSTHKAARRIRNQNNKEKIQQEIACIRITALGDSWFQHPLPSVRTITDHLSDETLFSVYSLSDGKAKLQELFESDTYIKVMEREQPDFFLLSAGGNDLFGTELPSLLHSKIEKNELSTTPEQFLKKSFSINLDIIISIYDLIFEELVSRKTDLKILIHGYASFVPTVDKYSWVGKTMIAAGIRHQKDRQELVNYIIDRFNERLQKLAVSRKNVFYIDLRLPVLSKKYGWFDEVHPNSDGFKLYAEIFKKKILELQS